MSDEDQDPAGMAPEQVGEPSLRERNLDEAYSQRIMSEAELASAFAKDSEPHSGYADLGEPDPGDDDDPVSGDDPSAEVPPRSDRNRRMQEFGSALQALMEERIKGASLTQQGLVDEATAQLSVLLTLAEVKLLELPLPIAWQVRAEAASAVAQNVMRMAHEAQAVASARALAQSAAGANGKAHPPWVARGRGRG